MRIKNPTIRFGKVGRDWFIWQIIWNNYHHGITPFLKECFHVYLGIFLRKSYWILFRKDIYKSMNRNVQRLYSRNTAVYNKPYRSAK